MIRNLALLALASSALSACATKGFVRTQVETSVAAERSAREQADTDINGKVTTMGNDLTALRDEFGAKITAMENGMKFAFPVTFAFDDATVRDQDRASLDRFVQVVNKYYGGSVVTVEGHADPAGARAYNLALSKRRAESVAAYLTTAGLTGVDLRSVGLGEDRLVVKGAERDDPGAQTNRRVVFVVESAGAGRMISSIPR